MRYIGKQFRFKTIIINKKLLLKVGIYTLIAIIFLCVFICLKKIITPKINVSLSNDFYISIIENEIPDSKSINFKPKDFIEKIVGFDLADPKSILGEYSSVFTSPTGDRAEPSKVAAPDTTTAPTAPKPTENGEIHDIKQVNISKGMNISNETDYVVDAQTMASEKLKTKIDDNGPQVLIVHTHTTESYTDSGKTKYSSSDSNRTTDESKNVVAVGKVICDELNKKGINTIHNKTVHDYPSYNGAYGRSLATAKEELDKNPSIKVVLDVHRDGLVRADGTKLKVSADINGTPTAQLMLVIGTNASGLSHDGWRDNMVFASKIQSTANDLYPNLMRPLNLRQERFNQHLTSGSLILEVGSNGNTLNESIEGGKDIANVIAEVLKN